MSITYITSFLDISRGNWENCFSRSFEKYLDSFTPFIPLFNKSVCDKDEMIIFIDDKHIDKVKNKINEYCDISWSPISDNDCGLQYYHPLFNFKIIPINEQFMEQLPMWKTLPRETEIMARDDFKDFVGVRQCMPEHTYPKYTLINHCKIDLICLAINSKYNNNEYCAWVDFGFFGNKENIPNKLLDLQQFRSPHLITYTLIEPIEEVDKHIEYTIKYAPERIGGFFFLGSQDALLEYQKLYHEILHMFQYELNIPCCDDDQHLALQCYFKRPELFDNILLGQWHSIFRYFQKT